METRDLTESKMTKKKKEYHAPTVKSIGEVRNITRGSTVGNTDANGSSGPRPDSAPSW